MNIPVLRGRAFTDQDSEQGTKTIIISEAMARRDWPGEDAIGKRLSFNKDSNGQFIWREVVGIVGNIRHFSLEQEPIPQMYLPYQQITTPFMSFVTRTTLTPSTMVAALRNEVLAIDKDQPVYNIRTMEQLVSEFGFKTSFYHAAACDLCGRGFAACDRRDLRRDELFSHRAHARNRHSHGSGRKTKRCVEARGRTGL